MKDGKSPLFGGYAGQANSHRDTPEKPITGTTGPKVGNKGPNKPINGHRKTGNIMPMKPPSNKAGKPFFGTTGPKVGNKGDRCHD